VRGSTGCGWAVGLVGCPWWKGRSSSCAQARATKTDSTPFSPLCDLLWALVFSGVGSSLRVRSACARRDSR
jgi:hypothetical protein